MYAQDYSTLVNFCLKSFAKIAVIQFLWFVVNHQKFQKCKLAVFFGLLKRAEQNVCLRVALHQGTVKMLTNRSLLFTLLFMLVALTACATSSPAEEIEWRGAALLTPIPATDFALLNGEGQTVRLSDFRGKIVLLYFGYTFCPDVCPTTLADLAQIQRRLDDQAQNIQVLMVMVDPERDIPEIISPYVKTFHPSFIGLSGTPAEIAAVAEGFGVFYEPEETGDDYYFIAHTASVFLIDQQGVFRLMYPFGMKTADMITDLQHLLTEDKS